MTKDARMKLNLSVLTESEIKIRKIWKNFYFIFYSIALAVFIIFSFIYVNFLEGTPEKLGENTVDFVLFIFSPALIFYHFAYKKGGTLLLTLYLYLEPFDFLIKGFVFSHLPFPYNFSVIGVIFLISIVFYILNWKLRKINKKLQFNEIYPEKYLLKVNTFSNATSQSELDSFYASLIQEWPQFEKRSTHLYNQHLANLKH